MLTPLDSLGGLGIDGVRQTILDMIYEHLRAETKDGLTPQQLNSLLHPMADIILSQECYALTPRSDFIHPGNDYMLDEFLTAQAREVAEQYPEHPALTRLLVNTLWHTLNPAFIAPYSSSPN